MESHEILIGGSALETWRETADGMVNIYNTMLSSIGLTGQKIADLSGTRPQYISDIKRRRRPLSREMYLRTLSGLFGDHRWLISGDLHLDTQRIISLYPYITCQNTKTFPLPLMHRPFLGPKMSTEDWDGSFICVTSPIMEQAQGMRNPYVLALPFNDCSGRLRRGDHLLVDQTDNRLSEHVLIKTGWGVKLVRTQNDQYVDVESEDRRYPANAPIIGNVMMLLMGGL